MRINVMNKYEMDNIEEITKIINEAFSKKNYKVKVVPYDFEKSRIAHREYYRKNKERLQAYHKERAKNKKIGNILGENKQEESIKTNPKEIKAVEVKDTKIETKPIEKKDTKVDSKIVAAKDNKTKTELVKNKKS